LSAVAESTEVKDGTSEVRLFGRRHFNPAKAVKNLPSFKKRPWFPYT
jgi:hypothetical protein